MEPQQCTECEVNICLKCLVNLRSNDENTCPNACLNPIFKDCERILRIMLEKLNFKCLNHCSKIIPYFELTKHELECPEFKMMCLECGGMRKRRKFKNQKDNKIKKIQEEIKEVKAKVENMEKLNNDLKEENIRLKDNLFKTNDHKSYDSLKLVLYDASSNDPFSNKNFEYKLYRSSCHHYKNHNFVCIFSCCNKAFPCFICHENESDHSYRDVLKGYCCKCLAIFSWEKTYFCPNCGQYKHKKTDNLNLELKD